MLHSLFSDTLILPKKLHMRFANTASEGMQLNIYRHVSTTSWDLVSTIFLIALLITKIQRLEL